MRTTIRRALPTLIPAMLIAACGGDSTSPTQTPFVGTYGLQTVNGNTLPFIALQSGQSSISIVSDRFVVTDGGTWSEEYTLRTTSNGQTTTQVSSDGGTWLRSGNSLAFSSTKTNSIAYSGTFSTNRLDLVFGSSTYVFRK